MAKKTAAQNKQAKTAVVAPPAPKTKAIKKENKIQRLEPGQQLSYRTYYRVLNIRGNDIYVQDQSGDQKIVSKEIVEKMPSGTHFAKEIPMTMTGLAELLETFSDTVFTVCFHKQPTVDGAKEKLEGKTLAEIKKNASNLAKQLTEGDLCTMTCHLVNVENNLGRSTVIDLTAVGDNKFRQIDHRTIEHIIFKNIKYVLKKGSKKLDVEEEKKDLPLWDPKKLEIGNWFSTTMYFDVKFIEGEIVMAESNNVLIEVDRKIIEQEMDNANVFDKEEKLPLTKVIKVFKEAKSAAFTICFNAKVDSKDIQERLQNITQKELSDSKTLSKELLLGAEKTIVGRLTKTEAKLGRSLIKTLPDNHFASVDHRTIQWLILKKVKYIVQ